MTKSFLSAVLASCFLVTTACADDQNPVESKQPTKAVAQQATVPEPNSAPVVEQDWRALDPENTLYITTDYGVFVVELAPEMAPKHVAQIKKLARQKFYDDLTFHRVIDGFMNQTGDPRGDGTGDSQEPDIPAEFTFRRGNDMKVTLTGRQMTKVGEADVGFFKSLPVASQPIGQAMLTKDGKVEAWGLHCPGTASMARGGDNINSANSQFFLMRNSYPSLNRLYSIWGRVVWGNENLTKIKVGTKGETPNFTPDKMLSVRVAADIPESERLPVRVMKTNSKSFQAHLEKLKSTSGKYPEVCDIPVPARLAK